MENLFLTFVSPTKLLDPVTEQVSRFRRGKRKNDFHLNGGYGVTQKRKLHKMFNNCKGFIEMYSFSRVQWMDIVWIINRKIGFFSSIQWNFVIKVWANQKNFLNVDCVKICPSFYLVWTCHLCSYTLWTLGVVTYL